MGKEVGSVLTDESHSSVTGENQFLFDGMTTVLLFWELVGDHAGTFSGQSNRPATPVPAQRLAKWKDRSIIPGGVRFLTRFAKYIRAIINKKEMATWRIN